MCLSCSHRYSRDEAAKLHESPANTEIMSTDATDDTTKAPEKVRMCFSGYPIMSTLVEKVEIMMEQMFASECFNVPFPTKSIHIATIP
jgi:trehalose utilization protein